LASAVGLGALTAFSAGTAEPLALSSEWRCVLEIPEPAFPQQILSWGEEKACRAFPI
jgi:hypothetical protein